MLTTIGGNSFQVCQYLPSLPGLEEFARPEKGKKNGHRKQLRGFAVDKLLTRYVDAAVQSSEALLGRKVIWLVSLKVLCGLYMGFIFPRPIKHR